MVQNRDNMYYNIKTISGNNLIAQTTRTATNIIICSTCIVYIVSWSLLIYYGNVIGVKTEPKRKLLTLIYWRKKRSIVGYHLLCLCSHNTYVSIKVRLVCRKKLNVLMCIIYQSTLLYKRIIYWALLFYIILMGV